MKYRSYIFSLITLIFLSSSVQATVGFKQWLKYDDSTPLHCTQESTTTSNGLFTYVISFCDKSIVTFKRETDDSLTQISSITYNDADGIHPEYVALISPDDRHLYVAGLTEEGGNYREALFVFDINSTTGALTQKQIFDHGNTLSNIQDAVFSSDGNHIYAISTTGNLYNFTRAGNGILSVGQKLTDGQISPETSSSATRLIDLALTHDEQFLYLSATPSYLIRLKRDNSSGALTHDATISFEDFDNNAGIQPRNLTISPDDKHIYTMSLNGNFSGDERIVQVVVDSAGVMSVGQVVAELPDDYFWNKFFTVDDLVLSENGRLMYLVDSSTESIQLWGRDVTTGALSFYSYAEENDGNFPNRFFSQQETSKFSPDHFYLYNAVNDGLAIIDVTVDTTLSFSDVVDHDINSSIEFELDVANNGPSSAHNVKVTLQTPNLELTNVSISGSDTSCEIDASNESVVCHAFELVDQAGQTITVQATAPSTAQTITMTASIEQDQLEKQVTAPVMKTFNVVDDDSAATNGAPVDSGVDNNRDSASALSVFTMFLMMLSVVVRVQARSTKSLR